jgi:hypothetical protein
MKIRGKIELISPDLLVPNSFNPNEMNEETLAKERKSLEKFGYVRAIIVRGLPKDRYEIIDGEHRWRLLKEAGVSLVPIRNLGKMSVKEAKQLTIVLNETRGQSDFIKLADLFGSITDYPVEEMAEVLPYSAEELTSMVEAADYDWSEYDFGGYTETMVTDYVIIPCRVTEHDHEIIQRKAGAICDELGIKADKEAVKMGLLLSHLVRNLNK